MLRRASEIIVDLESLAVTDFDNGRDGWERLEELCQEAQALNDPHAFAPAMFRAMERLEGADLGSPGPIVHSLEDWRGTFEPYLVESIRRRPTPVTTWMINRILNARPPDAASWIELLVSVADHPSASAGARASAQHFVEYQRGKAI
jgi:hypothetical protein